MIASATPLQILLDVLLYFTGLIILFPCLRNNGNRETLTLGTFLALLFFLFPYWGGDYFNYKEYFELVKSHNDTPLEDIYVTIINISPSYTIFRLIIWGSALFLLRSLFDLNDRPALLMSIFYILFIPVFSYTRVSLSMSLIFLGGFLINSKNNFQKKILGLVLVGTSYLFHRTAVFGIAVVLLATLFREIGKKGLIVFICILPLILSAIKYLLGNLMVFDLSDNLSDLAMHGDSYLQYDTRVKGPGEIVEGILSKVAYYICLLLVIKDIWKGDFQTMPKVIKYNSVCLFLIVVVSSLFLIDMGVNTSIFYYRFLNFATIPTVIYLSWKINNKGFKGAEKLAVVLGCASASYSLIYAFYGSFF